MNQKNTPFHNLFKNPKSKQLAPGIHPGIGLDSLKKLTCVCGHDTFIQCSNAYYASPLQSVSGMPTLVQLPQGFVCAGCGKKNEFDKKCIEPQSEDPQNSTPPPSDSAKN